VPLEKSWPCGCPNGFGTKDEFERFANGQRSFGPGEDNGVAFTLDMFRYLVKNKDLTPLSFHTFITLSSRCWK
jgi:hypothetical protein